MKINIAVFLIIAGALFAVIRANTAERPLVADEWMNRSASESLLLTGKPRLFGNAKGLLFGHPPLYLYLLALSYKLFGIGDNQARFIGIFFFSLNLILIWLLCKNLYPKNRLAPQAALLFFASSPLVIQGSLMIDIDQTLLTSSATLFLYCFLRFAHWPAKARVFILGLAFFLAACSKFSLPPILLLCMAAYYSLRREFIRGIIEILGIACIGAGLFWLSWRLYCYSLNFREHLFTPFIYIFQSFLNLAAGGGILEKLISAGRDFLRTCLWASPYLILLYFYALFKQAGAIIREKVFPRGLFLSIFVAVILFGYSFVGGLSYGFPKSQFPMMPALSVLIAGSLPPDMLNKKAQGKLAVILVLLYLYLALFAGDIIYLVFYSLKEAFIYGQARVFGKFSLALFLYWLSPVLSLGLMHIEFAGRRFLDKCIYAIAITALAANFSLDMSQAKADYITTAEYGARGKERLLYFLKSSLKEGDSVLSTAEIIYDTRSDKSVFPENRVWNEPEAFLGFVKETRPRAIVYGTPLNTVMQFKRTLLNPEVLGFLGKHYRRQDFGSYITWIK